MVDSAAAVSVFFSGFLVELVIRICVRYVPDSIVIVGNVLMRMARVIVALAAVMIDTTVDRSSAIAAFAIVGVQVPDQMHIGNQLAITQCHNEQGMNVFSAFHKNSIAVGDLYCQINRPANQLR